MTLLYTYEGAIVLGVFRVKKAHEKQCCGSGSERIRTFLPDPDPNKRVRIRIRKDPNKKIRKK
jgi:hypothetical protein